MIICETALFKFISNVRLGMSFYFALTHDCNLTILNQKTHVFFFEKQVAQLLKIENDQI